MYDQLGLFPASDKKRIRTTCVLQMACQNFFCTKDTSLQKYQRALHAANLSRSLIEGFLKVFARRATKLLAPSNSLLREFWNKTGKAL